MALTNAEIEYMKKMPAVLRGIEEQLTRIADALEKLSEGSDTPANGATGM